MSDYSVLEDEELVILSKENDVKAFSILAERYLSAAEYHASRFCVPQTEKEDLAQDGMLGFISAVYAYNSEQGASFSTFANHCIRNRIVSSVRATSAKKNIPSELVVPLDEQCHSYAKGNSPEDDLISQSESERIYQLIKLTLTEKEKRVFLLFIAGKSYEQIAKEEGCTTKSIDGTLQRVRKKLREKLS